MKSKNFIYLTILSLIFILVIAAFLSAAEIYTWTDKDGNLHITDDPPPEEAKLKEVTFYSSETEKQGSDSQAPQNSRATDREDIKKSKEAAEAQRKADTAAKEAHEASIKASDAVLKAYDMQDKRASQGRQADDRVSEDDVKKAEREAMWIQEESREAWEKAKRASEKAEAARQRTKEDKASE